MHRSGLWDNPPLAPFPQRFLSCLSSTRPHHHCVKIPHEQSEGILRCVTGLLLREFNLGHFFYIVEVQKIITAPLQPPRHPFTLQPLLALNLCLNGKCLSSLLLKESGLILNLPLNPSHFLCPSPIKMQPQALCSVSKEICSELSYCTGLLKHRGWFSLICHTKTLQKSAIILSFFDEVI